MAIETPVEAIGSNDLAGRGAPIARRWAGLPVIHFTLLIGHGERMRRAVAAEKIDYLYLADKCGDAILCTSGPFPWHRISRLVRLTAWARGRRAGSAGQSVVHPIVKELRTQRGALMDLYGSLLMMPRSRSSAKITEGQRNSSAARSDALEDFLDE